MKHEKWLSCLVGAVLAFGISLGGTGCLVTAFELASVSMGAVAVICAVCGAVCALCFTVRRGTLMLAAICALLIGYLLREGTALLHIEALLNKVSTYYDMGYGWGVIGWSGEDLTQVPVTGALGLLGGITALAVAWTVCRRKSVFVAAVVGFLPLAACFVVTDTIPLEGWIFLLAVSMILLILTSSVRCADVRQGLRLTAMLLVPVLLFSTALFWLNPRADYQNRMKGLGDTVMEWVSRLPFVVTTPDGNITIPIGTESGDEVDLTKVGPKTLRQYAVMDVVAPQNGWVYLRGQSLDVYDGTSWNASPVSTGKDMYFPSENLRSAGWLTVSMRVMQSRQYVPYYISDYSLRDGTIANEGQLQEYRYQVLEFAQGKHLPSSLTVDKHRPVLYQCLELPDATRQAAETILEEVFAATPMPRDVVSNEQLAQQIRDYVQSSAQYDLDTQQMPEDAEDFAIWFLRESETGYCVHFASALTVLLRAADIPARYVTGYLFEAKAGTKTVVRAASAHAWVEYLDPNAGWTVLDATPSEWMDGPITDETVPEQTEPEDTQATQAPTDPEPTQSATQPTQPEDTTQATAPNGGAEPGNKIEDKAEGLIIPLRMVLWIGAAAALTGGQYWLRRGLRRKKMGSGHRNAQALACWQEVQRMARLTGQTPPEALETLAEKAKFSQHTLTMAERMEFTIWLEQARQRLRERPWIIRLAIRLIWAVE